MKRVDIDVIKRMEKNAVATNSYVPIKTSEVLKLLSPEFSYYAINIMSRTYHTASLHRGEDYLILENSFNRERAFRLSLYINGMFIPLGLERIIHRGERAESLNTLNSKEIISLVDNHKEALSKLNNIKVTEKIKNRVIKIIFGNREINLKDQENDISYDNLSDFLDKVLMVYKDGNYIIIKGNKIRKGRRKKNIRYLFNLSNKLYKNLKEEFPFIFI